MLIKGYVFPACHVPLQLHVFCIIIRQMAAVNVSLFSLGVSSRISVVNVHTLTFDIMSVKSHSTAITFFKKW